VLVDFVCGKVQAVKVLVQDVKELGAMRVLVKAVRAPTVALRL
jgi:hypothetical protein